MTLAVSDPGSRPAVVSEPAGMAVAAASVGYANRLVGWWLIGLSMVCGAVLGLWAFGGPFTPPAWFGAYDDAGRRLLRLAHIAAIMLPVLNFHFIRGLADTSFSRGTSARLCAVLLAGTVGLPAVLALASVWRSGLFVLPVPVFAVIGPVFGLAGGMAARSWHGWRAGRKTSRERNGV